VGDGDGAELAAERLTGERVAALPNKAPIASSVTTAPASSCAALPSPTPGRPLPVHSPGGFPLAAWRHAPFFGNVTASRRPFLPWS